MKRKNGQKNIIRIGKINKDERKLIEAYTNNGAVSEQIDIQLENKRGCK